MAIVHLTASTFFGGPERQMLGLGRALSGEHESIFISFNEGGKCQAFILEARRQGFQAHVLEHDTPRLLSAVRELAVVLPRLRANVLCCHGYKADLLGRLAARRAGIPAVAVSRGWTGEDFKVRAYEWLDRKALGRMDRVICVSQAQADKVQHSGVAAEKVIVIRNAIHCDRFGKLDPSYRGTLEGWFATTPRHIVGAAGRLSPEKGFDVLLAAAAMVRLQRQNVGFVIFGDGPLRQPLLDQARALGLNGSCHFAGFRPDLDRFLPCLDVLAISSHTEGLPNIALESQAAEVPVVGTHVGGLPEVVEDGITGYLVPPGCPQVLANRLVALLDSESLRHALGRAGKRRVQKLFTFEAQAAQYSQLFGTLTNSSCRALDQPRAIEALIASDACGPMA